MHGYLIRLRCYLLDSEKIADICKVLSVDTRIKMIGLLKGRTLCVNALAKNLCISPAAVSQHLRILRSANLVIADKQGYFVHYSVNTETLDSWNNVVKNLFD